MITLAGAGVILQYGRENSGRRELSLRGRGRTDQTSLPHKAMTPILIGIAGGSGSGKTTVARRVLKSFDEGRAILMDMDSYYKDLGHLTLPERRKVNFDHPDAFDTELFSTHLQALKEGKGVDKPVYDFSRSTRSEQVQRIEPAPIVVVEGIMILAAAEVRRLLDAKMFVETDGDIRFIRRLERDVAERGRSLESVIAQYTQTVRPMHHAFVEPSKRHADIIIPRGGKNEVAIQMVIADLKARISK